jgi:AraC-like DNA-binding protein
MDYREFPAPPPFDRLVHCVWFLSGPGDQYQLQPVVPDGRLELLVHRGDPFSRIEPDGSRSIQESLLVAGQLTGPIRLQPGSLIDVAGVRLTPLGAHSLLRLPLSHITDDVVSLRDVHLRVALALEAAVSRRGSLSERSHAVVTVLGRMLPAGVERGTEHVSGLLAGGFSGPISGLARRSGMSLKTLQRRFQIEVGLPPKVYQRVLRFRRAFRLLQQEEHAARVAAAVGYYDQAHMIRDFRRFAGTNPRRFFNSQPTLAQVFSTANHGDTKNTENQQ